MASPPFITTSVSWKNREIFDAEGTNTTGGWGRREALVGIWVAHPLGVGSSKGRFRGKLKMSVRLIGNFVPVNGGFSGGVTATNYTSPLQIGKLWAFGPLDFAIYAARQVCK